MRSATAGGSGWKANPREYSSWKNAKHRCFSPKNPEYKNYGERGITMCDRWRRSFANFIADMGEKPSPRHQLDRFPNNDGNYEPGNCRWATPRENLMNTRRNIGTHCKNGHELAGGNVRLSMGKAGVLLRRCQVCIKIGRDAWNARRPKKRIGANA